MVIRKSLILLACGAAIGGGQKDETKAPANAAAATAPAATLQPGGAADPVAGPPPDAGKALQRGYKALKAKKWDEAQAELKTVVTAAPDYGPARWALVRALAGGGKIAEITPQWEALMARDYVAYAGKLDSQPALK